MRNNLGKKLLGRSTLFILASILAYGLYDSKRFMSQNANFQRAHKMESVSNNLIIASGNLSFYRKRVGQAKPPMIGRIVTHPPHPERAMYYINEGIKVLGDEESFDDTLRFVYNSLLGVAPLDTPFTNQKELIGEIIEYAEREAASARDAGSKDLRDKYSVDIPPLNDIFKGRF